MNSFRHRRLLVVLTLTFLFMTVLAGYTWWDNQRIVVRHYHVTHPQVPAAFDGFRVVFVSDLEGRSFGPGQRRLIELIAAQAPDLLVFGGDYDDRHVRSLEPITDLVKGVVTALDVPVYFVLGEKDWYIESDTTRSDTLIRALEDLGAHYLNAPVLFKKGFDYIWLTPLRVGFVSDPNVLPAFLEQHPELSAAEVAFWRQGTAFRHVVKPTDFVVVVEHEPFRDFPSALQALSRTGTEATTGHNGGHGDNEGTIMYTDHDLYLAGHTHGGQIRLPFIGPLVEPNRGFFPGDDYVKGLFVDSEGRYQVVSAGLGASGPRWARFRFLNPPEIVVVTLDQGE